MVKGKEDMAAALTQDRAPQSIYVYHLLFYFPATATQSMFPSKCSEDIQ